jgi:hypothetical protein
LVPLHPSACNALNRYATLRRRIFPQPKRQLLLCFGARQGTEPGVLPTYVLEVGSQDRSARSGWAARSANP